MWFLVIFIFLTMGLIAGAIMLACLVVSMFLVYLVFMLLYGVSLLAFMPASKALPAKVREYPKMMARLVTFVVYAVAVAIYPWTWGWWLYEEYGDDVRWPLSGIWFLGWFGAIIVLIAAWMEANENHFRIRLRVARQEFHQWRSVGR